MRSAGRDAALSDAPLNANIDSAIFGAGVNVVTTKKLFGGYYGFTVLFAGANNRLQGTEIDANPGQGISDTVISPIALGWHGKRADSIASYTLYAPTGRYEDGASNNTGLGMCTSPRRNPGERRRTRRKGCDTCRHRSWGSR